MSPDPLASSHRNGRTSLKWLAPALHQVGIPDEDSDATDEGEGQEAGGEEIELTDSDEDEDRPRRIRCAPS